MSKFEPMEKLFQEFEGVDLNSWLEKIRTDLKGKSEDLLTYQAEKEIQVKSWYHRSEVPKGKFSIGKNGNNWSDRRKYDRESNTKILDDLNNGINHVSLTYHDAQFFDVQTKDIKFEFAPADVKIINKLAADGFRATSGTRINFDILANGICNGSWTEDHSSFTDFFKNNTQHATVWVEGYHYANAGASCIQELAIIASHFNEYVELAKPVDDRLIAISKQIFIEMAATEDFFLNIAKFKVIRHLIRKILEAHGVEGYTEPISVYGVTGTRNLAQNDANNNLLRQTTQAMSAILGGCDAITVTSPEWADATHRRMAKNIPLVLKEESYLHIVGDAADGAYYVEELCNQLLTKSWELFKSIEEKGGFIESIESGYIQGLIRDNRDYMIEQINSKEKTFLGVNKYPSTLEEWKNVSPVDTQGETDFEPIRPFYLEQFISKEVHEQS